jgi:hypothetical protein
VGRSPIQDLCSHKVFEILVIGELTDCMTSTFKIMSPFLERRHYREHFFVVDFAVDFAFVHLSRVVSNRVQSSIDDLGENCADCQIACGSFNHYGPNRLEMP